MTPCIKIDKPLVVYKFWQRYALTAVTMLGIYKILVFPRKKNCNFKVVLGSYDIKIKSNILAPVLLNLLDLLWKSEKMLG